MITQSHVNQRVVFALNINLPQSVYLDYLVKKSLISDSAQISLDRAETVSRLPLVFSKLDTVYRHLKTLEKSGALVILKSGRTDIIEVRKDIVNCWLDDVNEDYVLSLFLQDLRKEVTPHAEPDVNRTRKQVINRKTKTMVFERDKYRCLNCDTHLGLSVDHIIPESKGGSSQMDNLQTLCITCNKSKASKTMEEWLGGAQ